MIQERLLPVFQRHRIIKAILFGSWARGEASRHSDVDLVLVQLTTKRFLARYEGVLYDLALALPEAPIEALIYTPEEFEMMRQRAFITQAMREGIVLYESK